MVDRFRRRRFGWRLVVELFLRAASERVLVAMAAFAWCLLFFPAGSESAAVEAGRSFLGAFAPFRWAFFVTPPLCVVFSVRLLHGVWMDLEPRLVSRVGFERMSGWVPLLVVLASPAVLEAASSLTAAGTLLLYCVLLHSCTRLSFSRGSSSAALCFTFLFILVGTTFAPECVMFLVPLTAAMVDERQGSLQRMTLLSVSAVVFLWIMRCGGIPVRWEGAAVFLSLLAGLFVGPGGGVLFSFPLALLVWYELGKSCGPVSGVVLEERTGRVMKTMIRVLAYMCILRGVLSLLWISSDCSGRWAVPSPLLGEAPSILAVPLLLLTVLGAFRLFSMGWRPSWVFAVAWGYCLLLQVALASASAGAVDPWRLGNDAAAVLQAVYRAPGVLGTLLDYVFDPVPPPGLGRWIRTGLLAVLVLLWAAANRLIRLTGCGMSAGSESFGP